AVVYTNTQPRLSIRRRQHDTAIAGNPHGRGDVPRRHVEPGTVYQVEDLPTRWIGNGVQIELARVGACSPSSFRITFDAFTDSMPDCFEHVATRGQAVGVAGKGRLAHAGYEEVHRHHFLGYPQCPTSTEVLSR